MDYVVEMTPSDIGAALDCVPHDPGLSGCLSITAEALISGPMWDGRQFFVRESLLCEFVIAADGEDVEPLGR